MLDRYCTAGALLLFVIAPAAVLSGSCAITVFTPEGKDGIRNGDEADVDCGGFGLNKCAEDRACTQSGDCASGVCSACTKSGCTGMVCTLPSCTDSVANGSETDIDCGGSCSDKCANDQKCMADGDCASTFCRKGLCVSACNNSIKDGTEADVDCGGSCSAKCAEGQPCGTGDDCASAYCTSAVCVSHCATSAKDGDETDIDCGGSCSTKCSGGRACSVDGDCTSGACFGKLCVANSADPGCFDQMTDGSETDLDCGGGACDACGNKQSCLLDSDCSPFLKCTGSPGTKTCQLP
jgi:hypothetical protein